MNVLYQGFRFIIVRLTQKNQHFLPEFLFFRSTAQAYFKVIGPIYSNLWISTFLSFWLFYCLLYQSQCCPTLLWTYYSKNKTCSLSPFSVSSVRKLITFCAHRGKKLLPRPLLKYKVSKWCMKMCVGVRGNIIV